MATIEPVAFIRTPFSTKFGIPRQSGLVPSEGKVIFTPAYRSPEIIRGLEGFSHIWLIWGFSESTYQGGATVRPPRLGGNKRVGIFATRSPFRPNGLGLSAVSLTDVEYQTPEGPVLHVRGADLLNDTPIYDVKPYLPFADSIPNAAGGYTDETQRQKQSVVFLTEIPPACEDRKEELRLILENDPRPHYQNDPRRKYAFEYAGLRVVFTCSENVIYVKAVTPLS